MVDALLDPDYFLKAVDDCLRNRFGFSEQEVLKRQQAQQDARLRQRQRYADLLAELRTCDKVSYLERTIYPVLYPGLMMLDRERPEDPLTALAMFLLQNKKLCETPTDLIYTGAGDEGEGATQSNDAEATQQGLDQARSEGADDRPSTGAGKTKTDAKQDGESRKEDAKENSHPS